MSLLADVSLGELKPPTKAFAPNLASNEGAVKPLENFFSMFIGFLTILAGLMFLIYFIFAALAWVTSGGDKGKVEHARQQMTNAALGLAITVAAYGIVGVVGKVFGLDILNPASLILSIMPK